MQVKSPAMQEIKIHRPFTPGTGNSPRDKMHIARLRPCPGSVVDPKASRHRFNRWHDRPQSAWRLYWRTHPQEWAKVQELRGY